MLIALDTMRTPQLRCYVRKDLFLWDTTRQRLVQVQEPGLMCFQQKPVTLVMEYFLFFLTKALLFIKLNYHI